MANSKIIQGLLKKYQHTFHNVVPFTPEHDKLLLMNFTASNNSLTDDVLNNTGLFTGYIKQLLTANGVTYGIGGYNEHRTIYSRSGLFNNTTIGEYTEDGVRRLHLGIDIWGKAGTPVFAAIGGMVHSYAFNDNYGDYGATIVLLHQLDGIPFYTLYGHLSLTDINGLKEGQYISRSIQFAHFGLPHENGHWPPHLHFQIITDMEMKKGDYPGVCSLNEKDKYLSNCPDPDLILQMMKFAETV